MKSVFALLTLLYMFSLAHGQSDTDKTYDLLVGTYTKPGQSQGIYVYTFDTETGDFSEKTVATGIKNPSFLTVSQDRKHVYAVSEVGEGQGSVSAYAFNPSTGKLDFLNSTPSGGDAPCYVSVDDENRYVFVGNYSGGSLSAIPVEADGSLGADIQTIRHEGSSIHKNQTAPHVHATVLSKDGDYLYVPDLGTDKINIYQVDVTKSAPLTPAQPAFVSVEAGSGPRHLTLHPRGPWGYAIQELTGLITVFDEQDGTLTAQQTVAMPAPGFEGAIDAADIHISPDGNFLYGSLRGDINELVIYSIDDQGRLTYVGRQSTMGKTPRNFAIDPTGNFLLVGNSGSNQIVIFKRDQKTGLLTPTNKKIAVGDPVCLKFVAL